jgi:class 3 adenylate cyclase
MVLPQTQYPRVIQCAPSSSNNSTTTSPRWPAWHWSDIVGHHLNRLAPVVRQIDGALPVRNGLANSDILRSYLGLLVQGKSDFDAIENFCGDAFFKQALGIALLPSSPTLRQCRDARSGDMFDLPCDVDREAAERRAGRLWRPVLKRLFK